MRITFVLPFAGIAGGVRVVAIYAERLQARGHEVTVVSTRPRPGSCRERARTLVSWLAGHAPRRDPSHLDDVDVEHRVVDHAGPLTDADVPDADVVVATWWETAEWVAAFSEEKGAKAYFLQHYEAHPGQPVERVRATWMLPLRKIVVARWLAEMAAVEFGDRDVTVVPNAVDTALFHADPRGRQEVPTVGLMYAHTPYKGVGHCLEAIGRASRTLPDLKLRTFGAHQVTNALPLPASSTHALLPPQDELREIYAACDAWLFGSRTEGFGLPILEAMACRTPVIATPVGAAPELLATGGGVLVSPDDPEEMAAAILHVTGLSDPQWREMSDAAWTIASSYDWDDATDLFESALVDARQRGRGDDARDRGTDRDPDITLAIAEGRAA